MSTPRRRSGGGRRDARDASWMADEVDDANAVADARFSTVDRDYIGLRGGSEEDEEDDEDDDDEEGLLDVDDDDDSSEDSEEDSESESESEDGGREGDEDDDDVEYSDSEEMALAVAMKAQKKRLDGRVRRDAVNAEDEDDDEDDDEDGDAGFGIKGKKKMDFYGDDDVDHEGLSDEEDRVEEEKEARRMRKLMAEEMRAEDFGVESDEDEDEDEDDDAKATLGAKAANLRRGDGKKASSASKASKKTSVSVETLTAEERAERLAAEDDATAANDAPELIALSKELTSTLASIEASVEPLVKAAKDGDFATEDGISYLDTKYLLMLSYCSSIVFYLLLKAEGRSVKDHPVIERLVEIRLYLEKLRPIDKKLQYQIDKLLKLASASERATTDKADDDEDPLRFAPNPSALVSKTADEEEGGDGVYRPPKMLPTAMDYEVGGKDAKELRRNKEQRRRAGRSQLIKELAREVGEAPEEIGHGDEDMVQSAFAKREMARMEARARVEEDLFTRVPLSKQERRRQKASTRNINSLAAVGDFGDDVADLVDRADEMDKVSRKRRLVDTVADGYKAPSREFASGEQDVPFRDSLGERRSKYERGVARSMQRREMEMRDEDDGPSGPHIDDDDEYVAAASLRDRKRRAKEEMYAREPGLVVAPEEDVDGKREIGQKIMANRGLTPHRNKEAKNPRVRLRGKFGRAVTRRKGSVRDVKEKTDGYGGELTGVKTSVVKSRKFN